MSGRNNPMQFDIETLARTTSFSGLTEQERTFVLVEFETEAGYERYRATLAKVQHELQEGERPIGLVNAGTTRAAMRAALQQRQRQTASTGVQGFLAGIATRRIPLWSGGLAVVLVALCVGLLNRLQPLPDVSPQIIYTTVIDTLRIATDDQRLIARVADSLRDAWDIEDANKNLERTKSGKKRSGTNRQERVGYAGNSSRKDSNGKIRALRTESGESNPFGGLVTLDRYAIQKIGRSVAEDSAYGLFRSVAWGAQF